MVESEQEGTVLKVEVGNRLTRKKRRTRPEERRELQSLCHGPDFEQGDNSMSTSAPREGDLHIAPYRAAATIEVDPTAHSTDGSTQALKERRAAVPTGEHSSAHRIVAKSKVDDSLRVVLVVEAEVEVLGVEIVLGPHHR